LGISGVCCFSLLQVSSATKGRNYARNSALGQSIIAKLINFLSSLFLGDFGTF
jgi:hypothetical protein